MLCESVLTRVPWTRCCSLPSTSCEPVQLSQKSRRSDRIKDRPHPFPYFRTQAPDPEDEAEQEEEEVVDVVPLHEIQKPHSQMPSQRWHSRHCRSLFPRSHGHSSSMLVAHWKDLGHRFTQQLCERRSRIASPSQFAGRSHLEATVWCDEKACCHGRV